ncbi:MAG: GFA family protein [Myxococcales bacterium]|nr:GFA family protein [Myxococcales bacterium]
MHEDKTENLKTYEGSCHCGAVKYRVTCDLGDAMRCNCRICTKVAQTGVIVKPVAFELLSGSDVITHYPNAVGKRSFCSRCGIHCFAEGNLPEVGGEFVSVNVNTLDGVELKDLQVVHWDGRHDNWQAGPRPQPWPIFP